MTKFDPTIYADVVRVRKAWCFDIGTMLMRMFGYMFTIGTVSMLTLAGYSAFIAGTVAGVLSIGTFLIGPRIAKLIDERGQRRIVPLAALASLAGLAGLVTTVVLRGPLPLCYVFAVIIGCNPNAQALARTRWTFLVRTGRYGAGGLDIRTVYSYEGVLEDIAFAASPAINIALAAAIHPAAGMVFGGVCLLVGTTVLMFARDTEPEVGWLPDVDGDGTGDADPRFAADDSPWVQHASRTVFGLSGTVRVLFFCTLLLGLVFGSFDSSVVVFCQELGKPTLASGLMAFSGCISMVSGCVFGMMRVKSGPARMLLITGTLFGLGYFLTSFTFDAISLYVLTAIASPFYAPYFITMNTVCEKAVPSSRLTEGITWMNAGTTAGFAVGPTAAGVVMDAFGGASGLWLTGVAAVLIPVVVVLTRGVVLRGVPA